MSKSENLHKFLQRTTNGRPRLYGFALPISVICEQVGFSNYMHFSKTFKAYYGMSPSDYKKAAN